MDLTNLEPAKMQIKVLGTGCKKCKTLESYTKEAVQQLAIDAEVIKIEDITEIMKYAVMTTPALVVNDKVVVKGKLPSVQEIKDLLSK